jgi:hypothetical protein
METYFVVKLNKQGRVLVSEHLHEDDAMEKARGIRGAVVTNVSGQVLSRGLDKRRGRA